MINGILWEGLEKIRNKEITEYRMLRFLEDYYDGYIVTIEEAKEEQRVYPKELTLPLKERSSGVFDALQELVRMGVDLDEGDCFNPLMMAVAYADAPMTEFLIKHGANPRYWPNMEKDGDYGWGNYYYDDLDIAYMNEHWPRSEVYVSALLNTAKVLVTDGNLGEYGGICLLVDVEKREISFSGPFYKF